MRNVISDYFRAIFLTVAVLGLLGCFSAVKIQRNKIDTIVTSDLYRQVDRFSATAIVNTLRNNDSRNVLMILNIHSPGGSATDGQRIINAIETTDTRVHMIVNYYAASMAAILLCYADSVTIKDDAKILFHTARYYDDDGVMHLLTGKNYEEVLKDHPVTKMFDKGCKELFTPLELRLMFVFGEDLTLTGKEFKQRLERHRNKFESFIM